MHSDNRGVMLAGAALLAFASAGHGAPRKAPRPAPVKPETVYVAAPSPAPSPAREMRVPEPARVPDSRRTESAFSGPLRDYRQAFGGYAGFYVAEVLGSNPYAMPFWEFYPAGQAFFFQFGVGVGPVQSGFSQDVVGGDLFENNLLLSMDALGGFSLTGMPGGNGRAGGLFPYVLAGVTAFWQGGLPIVHESVPNIGGVIGFGNRTRLPFLGGKRAWAFNYVVRDNIYAQKIRTKPSMTQNFALMIGVQKYW